MLNRMMILMLTPSRGVLMIPSRGRVRSPPRPAVSMMNRLMFDESEVSTKTTPLHAYLPFNDPRCQHVASILRKADGETVRVGLLDKGVGEAQVRWRWPEGKRPDSFPGDTRQGREKQVSKLTDVKPDGLELFFEQLGPTLPRPRVDLILALPRPLQLQRMLPMIAQLGVDNLILTNAAKVEKDYFGSHLIKYPEQLRAELVEGLTQVGTLAQSQ